MSMNLRKLAVVTGTSQAIGLELARLCARSNYDLVIADDGLSLLDAAQDLATSGVVVCPVRCDLSTPQGVDALRQAIAASGRPADILIANAVGAGGAPHGRQVIDDAHACIDETIYMVDQVSRSMRGLGRGRILINLQAVYDASNAFVDYFSVALNRALKHCGVTVTCLVAPMQSPGAPVLQAFNRISPDCVA
jgi:short-subunit dehydrogenase